jgi:hypothetical protein
MAYTTPSALIPKVGTAGRRNDLDRGPVVIAACDRRDALAVFQVVALRCLQHDAVSRQDEHGPVR